MLEDLAYETTRITSQYGYIFELQVNLKSNGEHSRVKNTKAERQIPYLITIEASCGCIVHLDLAYFQQRPGCCRCSVHPNQVPHQTSIKGKSMGQDNILECIGVIMFESFQKSWLSTLPFEASLE